MPGTATTRGATKPKAAPRRASGARGAAAKDAAVAAQEQEPQKVTETVSAVPDAPEVAGGAARLGTEAAPVERETLFYVDGVGYTIPKTFAPNAALGYAHMVRTQGTSAGVDWAMERALGTVGYAVLREQDDLTQTQLDNMIALIIARIEGLPDPKPKSS